MNISLRPRKTTTYVIVFFSLACLLGGFLIVGFVNHSMKRYALREAEEKHRIILDRALATHTYFSEVMKPKLFSWSEPFRSADYFEPSWMSSTYAIRQINKTFRELNPGQYYFKEAAINARSPENEADSEERAFIRQLNANPDLELKSEIRFFEGKPHLAVMRRGELLEKSCLRCHSTPEAAPADLVALYGADRSFHRKEGETIQAISIRIPLSSAYSSANQVSFNISLFIIIALVCLMGVLFFLTKLLIMDPLSILRENVLTISTAQRFPGKSIALTTPSKEINSVVAAFNSMSEQLNQALTGLETKVEKRTYELKRKNDELSEENAKRRQAEEQTAASLKEKETLLQEIHHRVKNNLQVISSLLSLQSNSVDNALIKGVLKESQNRVYTMSVAHQVLYESENLSEIDLYTYLSRIQEALFQTYAVNSEKVNRTIETDEIKLTIEQASPLGLIVNELTSNSLKYAFPGDRKGTIVLRIMKLDGDLEVVVKDDGVGFPADVDWRESESLGLKLVKILAENQLDGTLNVKAEQGAEFIIRFPLKV